MIVTKWLAKRRWNTIDLLGLLICFDLLRGSFYVWAGVAFVVVWVLGAAVERAAETPD